MSMLFEFLCLKCHKTAFLIKNLIKLVFEGRKSFEGSFSLSRQHESKNEVRFVLTALLKEL